MPAAASASPAAAASVTEVNDLLQRFDQMRKMMKNMGKFKKMMARGRGVLQEC
jgi:signal recognition particle GTPase